MSCSSSFRPGDLGRRRQRLEKLADFGRALVRISYLGHHFGHPNQYSELGKERIRQLAAKNSFFSQFAVLSLPNQES